MTYDVAVIGGGPAGLMAAGQASAAGRKTILIEKNQQLGLKLLMTGGGRCNLTNNIIEARLMAANYNQAGPFLLSAFSRFGVPETIDFFESRGLKLKVEKNNQVFPLSDNAADVLQILIKEIKNNGGEIKLGDPLEEIILDNKIINKIRLKSGLEIKVRNLVLAVGGRSYPLTGSSGAGYEWLKTLDHEITPLYPALSPLYVCDKFVKDLEGLSLAGVKLSLADGADFKKSSIIGDIVFTSDGLSGPAALNFSRGLKIKNFNNQVLFLDLFPGENMSDLEKRLQLNFHDGHRQLKNVLDNLLPFKLIPVIIKLLDLNPLKSSSLITKDERHNLAFLLKNFSFLLRGIAGYERAMITMGGLKLSEVDPKTMRSKFINNLFIAGELLDVDGPTGGYNLQACWSTGYIAGRTASGSF